MLPQDTTADASSDKTEIVAILNIAENGLERKKRVTVRLAGAGLTFYFFGLALPRLPCATLCITFNFHF
jgi:hypothetical protein